jgi:Flp pilus assembly protein protease CpaA
VVVWDVRQRRIPNELVATIAMGGLIHASIVGGAEGLLWSFVGIVAGLAILFLPARAGLAGAADWKLAGALGAWCGAAGALYVVLYGTLLNGLLALLALLRLPRAQRTEVWHNVFFAVMNREINVPEPSQVPRARGVPFGVSLAVTAAGFLYLKMARG